MPFKITAIGDQGGDKFHGADDIDKFAKVFGDVDISATDPVFVATNFSFRDGKLRLTNTSKTHSLIIRFPDGGYSGDITLNVPTIASASDTLVTTSTNAGGGGSGEANTASNQGVGGVGLFISKVAVDLQFKNINAGSNKITVTNDAVNKEVDIDVAEANLTLANLGGLLSYSKLTLTNSIVNADVATAAAIAYSKLNLTGAIVNADVSTSAAIAWSKIAVPANTATTDTAQTLTNKNLTDATNTFRAWANADIATSAAIAYSKLNLGTSIVNSDIATAAAIAYSKLNLTGAIVNADISTSAAIAYSKLSLGTSIVNADISATAAIAKTKLASLAIVDADISTTLSWSKISKTGSVLADIGNVSFTSLATGDFLKWNGTNWINTAVSAGISTSATNTWSAVQTFNDGDLALRNPANTFSSIVKGGAQVSTDKTFTFPVAASDTILLEAATQTITNKTFAAGSNTITGIVDANIGTHTTTKITTSSKSLLNSAIAYNDQTNTWGAFDQIFKSSNFKIANPANTFNNIFVSAAIAADRTITLPLLTGNDTMVTAAFAQALTNKTIDAASNTISNIVDANIGTHTTTKITTSSKSLLNSAIVYNDQTNTYGAFLQTFSDGNFALRNPANTFSSIVKAGAQITADKTFTFPVAASDTIVLVAASQTLTNKTLTAPVIATISNTGTITLPTATDTLVGLATTDVLTNKTLTAPTINGTVATTGLTLPAVTMGGSINVGNHDVNNVAGYYLRATDASALKVMVGSNTAPIQDVHFFSDHVKQVGSTGDSLYFGYNSDWSVISFYSHNSGSNTELFTIDAAGYIKPKGVLDIGPNGRLRLTETNLTAQRAFTFPDAAGVVVVDTVAQTLTNKTLTAPVISSISNTGTVTLPTATDTLVARATTDSLTNKTIDASTSTLQLVKQDPIIKRTGYAVPKANTLFLEGVLADHTFGTIGTIANTYDTTEGVITTIPSTATTTIAVGLVSATTGVGICRRLFAGKARIRWKIDSTTTARLYFGFTSATALPISDTPLATTDNGIIVGWSTSDTTYQIYHHAGSGAVTKDAVTGAIAKDAAFHTVEINWTAAGNINVIFDGTSQVVNTDLPATTANLFFFAEGQTSAGTARTLSVKGVWLEFDK